MHLCAAVSALEAQQENQQRSLNRIMSAQGQQSSHVWNRYLFGDSKSFFRPRFFRACASWTFCRSMLVARSPISEVWPRLLDLMRSCQSRARTSRKLLLIPERSLFGEEAMLIPARQARSSKCPRNHSCHCRHYKSIIRSVKGSLRSLLNESTSWKKEKWLAFQIPFFWSSDQLSQPLLLMKTFLILSKTNWIAVWVSCCSSQPLTFTFHYWHQANKMALFERWSIFFET